MKYRLETGAAIAIATFSTVYSLAHIGYPFGTNPDELAKTEAVLTDEWKYWHPLWMIDLARMINFFADLHDHQSVVELGRSLAAISVGLMIFATWILARMILPAAVSLAAVLATAIVPMTYLPALTFKEDAFAAPWIIFSVVALIKLLNSPGISRAKILGICLGLASSSKYSGILATLLSMLILFKLRPDGVLEIRRYAVVSFATALAIFATIHIQALFELLKFASGMFKEFRHAVKGHEIYLPIWETGGVFHLLHSLKPGVGLPLLTLALIGLAAPMLASREQKIPYQVIVIFALSWYGIHEISPLKPYPGFQRYLLPAVPLLIILSAGIVFLLTAKITPRHASSLSAFLLLCAAAPEADSTYRFIKPIADDPRTFIREAVKISGSNALFDNYSNYDAKVEWFKLLGLKTFPDIIVVSSLYYDRFIRLDSYSSQGKKVQDMNKFYVSLFKLPYLEISNGGPSFGFFNPVLRVIAYDRKVESLQIIRDHIRTAAPNLITHISFNSNSLPQEELVKK